MASLVVSKTRLPGVDQKGMVIAPNVLDYSRGNAFVNLVFRGDPGGTTDLRIYNEAGRMVLYKSVPLGSGGQVLLKFDGHGDSSQLLGSGVYWVIANGGGITAKKPFVVVTKRKGK